MLEELSKQSGKSKKLILFEFYRNRHPRTFKKWIKDEQKPRHYLDDDKTIIELDSSNNLIERTI